MYEWNDETAERYARKYGDCATNSLPIERIQLPSDAVIVDIGCGTGESLRRAAESVTEGTLIGIDPTARMLEIARDKTGDHTAKDRIEYRLGSAEDLPVEDEFADFVFAFDSFDHWNNKERGLEEVRRVLHRQGQFVVVKDCILPDAEEAGRAFVEMLPRFGFDLFSEQFVEAEGVSFMMWIVARVD